VHYLELPDLAGRQRERRANMKSCKAIYSIATAVLCVVLAVTGTSAVWAQARTTPVEVKNQVGLDPANNTVKAVQSGSWTATVAGTLAATQSGEWNVGITGTPGVTQSGTWNVGITGTPAVGIDPANNTVKAAQSGTWNVNVANAPNVSVTNTPNVAVTNIPTVNINGTPNVAVTNTPTVNINSTNNTVKAPTQWNKIRLWTTDQVIAHTGTIQSANLQTAGYKEIRACIGSNSSGASLYVYVWGKTGAGSGSWAPLGKGNFAIPPANFISLGANFAPESGTCVFSFPVVSDEMLISMSNNTGGSVTVYSTSWVYLVN
jgi:hypothetical protein